MRTIKKIHTAVYAPIHDLVTYRALPSNQIDYLDPFLFLNHHGPQVYPPFNRGLPFGPHPHRGFETLTFVLAGDIVHRDTGSGESVIGAGGIQWMTAGRGLIHAEVSSEDFKEHGGNVEVIQLWFNLPAKLKMVAPHYVGLQQEEIPAVVQDEGKVTIHAVSGNWAGTPGPVASLTDIQIVRLELLAGGVFTTQVPANRSILCYVVRGKVNVNGEPAGTHNLVQFNQDEEEIRIEATEYTTLILGHGEPYNEPVVAQGPFVMNTQAEIMQAMRDYQMGKMGVWID
ncbi:pirin family protein [Adhaeribacter swui]|uniref:Pirin family protein n=1 Tax=Adhaeribacter swui TaxID=2086471 RepID=A0A7G7G397_9BACT|nr:pirin family protein [Adhaeribacter swui]QNF31631.1 pirin family protein [Adhaeribacter swui]